MAQGPTRASSRRPPDPRERRTSVIEQALAAPLQGEETAQLKQLFTTDSTLLMKTELPPGLIIPVAKALTVARVTKSRVLKMFVDMVLKAQVSKDRKGRVELMEALTALRRKELEELD